MKQRDRLNALLRSDLTYFIQRVFAQVAEGDVFLPNWHINVMAHHLTLVYEGKIKRLIITLPPRHMKSIAASVAFPAWLLGQDPTRRIIGVSYAQELANIFSIQTRQVMEEPWYLECFPETRLSDAKNTQAMFMTTQQGFRFATSVTGTLTGIGGNILIIDDPHKAEEALSETRRRGTIDWFLNTASTRLNAPESDAIVVIQQRLHEDDLAGYLLDKGGWVHLDLQAIAETKQVIPIGPGKFYHRKPGDVLHPERFSREYLDQTKAEMGPAAFAAQYQQRPVPAGGLIVDTEWFLIWEGEFVPEPGDIIVQSWDFGMRAGEKNDYSVCIAAFLRNGRLYILDVYRERIDGSKLVQFVDHWAKKWNAHPVIIESAGSSLFIADSLCRSDPTRYITHAPKDDKELRLRNVAFLIEAGWVALPDEAHWLPVFLQEVKSFPKGRFDDQVDALSQLLKWAYQRQRREMVPILGTGNGANLDVRITRF